jgi:hypothetical protein
LTTGIGDLVFIGTGILMTIGMDVSSRSFMLVSCHAHGTGADEAPAKCALNKNTTRASFDGDFKEMKWQHVGLKQNLD